MGVFGGLHPEGPRFAPATGEVSSWRTPTLGFRLGSRNDVGGQNGGVNERTDRGDNRTNCCAKFARSTNFSVDEM